MLCLINLAQGSQEWQGWRASVIGASDAPVIVGENPWRRRQALFNDR